MNISEKFNRLIDFVWKFAFNIDEFRWKQQGYQQTIVRRWAYIHKDIWSSTRYFGYPIFKLLWKVNPWLALISFWLIVSTDYPDGEVSRYVKKMRESLGIKVSGSRWWIWIKENFGHLNDGFADRCMAIPTIDFLTRPYVNGYAIATLYIIEFGGYPLIWILERLGIVKVTYSHTWIGKTKFGLQIFLISSAVIINQLFPGWILLPLWIWVFFGIILLFALFSVGCKINPMFLRFLPYAVTVGSVLAAWWGVYEALVNRNFYLAAPLMMISAVCDVLDGPIARKINKFLKLKKSNVGILADDIADWLNYAVALALILLAASVNIIAILFYGICTTIRLGYFYLQSKKKSRETGEKEGRAIFDGVPSTGVAFFIASLIFWKDSMINHPALLAIIVAVCGFGEIWFKEKWYHFNNIVSLPKTILLAILIFLILTGALGIFGEGSSFLFFSYLVLFYKRIADRIWHLDEKEKVGLKFVPKNQ
jgi:phosphatidylserine synthase